MIRGMRKRMKIKRGHFFVYFLAVLSVYIGCPKEEFSNNELIDFRNHLSVKSRRPVLIAHRGEVITLETALNSNVH